MLVAVPASVYEDKNVCWYHLFMAMLGFVCHQPVITDDLAIPLLKFKMLDYILFHLEIWNKFETLTPEMKKVMGV
jgi:hypothetical protein